LPLVRGMADEHTDDLEPEVIEGAEIETEEYDTGDDDEAEEGLEDGGEHRHPDETDEPRGDL
jgi:hypothetical protein